MSYAKEENKKEKILKQVVHEMGGEVKNFIRERNAYSVYLGGRKMLLEHHISIRRNKHASAISTLCKDVTHKLLVEASLTSVPTEAFYNETFASGEAKKQLERLRYPIVLKHSSGSNSLGLFVNIQDSKTALRILQKELPGFGSMVAQKMVFGKEYRILVLDNKIIAALEMVHPYITGDGTSRVRRLINQKQNTTDRRTPFNAEMKTLLKKQKVSLWTVLPKGKIIFFKGNCSLAEGGETRDATNEVHKDIKKMCVDASKIVDRYLVGIDIMCKDISKKPTKKSVHILEMNGKPDIYIHYNPTHGKTRNVLKNVLNFILKQPAE